MRIKTLVTLVLVFALLPLAALPASAEPEPDDWIWQATGPITSGTITGTITSRYDTDYYMFYVASQTQLTITLQPSTCSYDVYFENSLGSTISSEDADARVPQQIKYTTPIGTNRFFVRISDYYGCPYTVNLSPATSLLSGPGMPQATVATGEPNETALQAWGPLAGDTIYTGTIDTSNDEDWFAFYANAPFTLNVTEGSTCAGYYVLTDSDQDDLASGRFESDLFSERTYTPTSWQLFYLQFTAYGTGCSYRFAVSPASSIQTGPQPPPPPPPPPQLPNPMTGLTKRKTKSTVVVYWPTITGASSYAYRSIRGKRYGGWVGTGNAWVSFKKKSIPRRKGLRVEVQPVNAAGAGASQVIRIKR